MADLQHEYNISLVGNQLAVATYGIVEYLRPRKILRTIVAVLGLLIALTSVATISGMKIPYLSGFGIFTLFFVAPEFLWIATVSGPRFRLFLSFAPEKAQEARREAEQQFGESKAPMP